MKNILLTASLLFSTQVFSKSFLGILKGEQEATIKTKTQGVLKKILIKEGEKVNSGDVIALLDSEKEIIERDLAKVEYETALKDYKKSKKLSKYISKDELTKKKNEYLRKKSTYELKEYNLKTKKIQAPFDGVVARSHVKIGQSIGVGEKSFEVIDMKNLIIELDIDAATSSKLKIGQKVKFITTELSQNYAHNAEIYFISPALEKTSGTVQVKLKFPNQKIKNSYLFKSGTLVKVEL